MGGSNPPLEQRFLPGAGYVFWRACPPFVSNAEKAGGGGGILSTHANHVTWDWELVMPHVAGRWLKACHSTPVRIPPLPYPRAAPCHTGPLSTCPATRVQISTLGGTFCISCAQLPPATVLPRRCQAPGGQSLAPPPKFWRFSNGIWRLIDRGRRWTRWGTRCEGEGGGSLDCTKRNLRTSQPHDLDRGIA